MDTPVAELLRLLSAINAYCTWLACLVLSAILIYRPAKLFFESALLLLLNHARARRAAALVAPRVGVPVYLNTESSRLVIAVAQSSTKSLVEVVSPQLDERLELVYPRYYVDPYVLCAPPKKPSRPRRAMVEIAPVVCERLILAEHARLLSGRIVALNRFIDLAGATPSFAHLVSSILELRSELMQTIDSLQALQKQQDLFVRQALIELAIDSAGGSAALVALHLLHEELKAQCQFLMDKTLALIELKNSTISNEIDRETPF
jgi:hypothetical protein